MSARRILLLQGHPDPDPARLCRGLAAAYADAATGAGHEVTRIDVATLDFPLLTSPEAFEHGQLPPGLTATHAALLACDHLVIVCPLWLGTVPALLKGLLEQLLRPGIAFERRPGVPKPLLGGRSARLIVTMGTPPLVYRWWYGGYGIRGVERSILSFSGFAPVRRTLIGVVPDPDETLRRRWIEGVRALGAAGK